MRSSIRNVALPVIAFALVAASGVVHGVATGRWGAIAELAPINEQLNSVPSTLGDWTATDSEIPDDQLQRGEIEGYLSRRYVNRKTGSVVSVLVVLGRPGPIAVHTPDVCFRGAGYMQLGETAPHHVDVAGSGPCGLRVGNFTQPSAVPPENVRVFWSWSTDGRWDAPENPRFEFAGKPYLLKLYALRSMPTRDEPVKSDECLSFLREFLPAVQHAVFAEGQTQEE